MSLRFISIRTILILFPALLLIPYCSKGDVRVNYAKKGILEKYRKVAVLSIRTDIIKEEGFIQEMVRELIASENKKQGRDKFETYIIDVLNRNLLKKGFIPIQRARIKKVLKEQSFQHSGMTENATALGKLLKADAVFMGKITIRKEGGYNIPFFVACLFPPLFIIRGAETEMIFSGNMTTVEDGAIIISGSVSHKSKKYVLKIIDEMVEEWFDDLPDLD